MCSLVYTEGERMTNIVLYETHGTCTAHNVNGTVATFFWPKHRISINCISAPATRKTLEAEVASETGIYINPRDKYQKQISESLAKKIVEQLSFLVPPGQKKSPTLTSILVIFFHFLFLQVKRRRPHSRPSVLYSFISCSARSKEGAHTHVHPCYILSFLVPPGQKKAPTLTAIRVIFFHFLFRQVKRSRPHSRPSVLYS